MSRETISKVLRLGIASVGVALLPMAGSAMEFWRKPEIKPPWDACRQYSEAAIAQVRAVQNRNDGTGLAGFPQRLEDVCRILKSAKVDMDYVAQCPGTPPYDAMMSVFNQAKYDANAIAQAKGIRVYCGD